MTILLSRRTLNKYIHTILEFLKPKYYFLFFKYYPPWRTRAKSWKTESASKLKQIDFRIIAKIDI
jgi:hypothetical protein